MLEFRKDCNREIFVFVDDLTELETREFIVALGLELSEVDINYVNENIGKNPAALRSMEECINGWESVHDFVATQLAGVDEDLSEFPHEVILKVLEDYPEGVTPKYFMHMKSDGVDLSEPFAVGDNEEIRCYSVPLSSIKKL